MWSYGAIEPRWSIEIASEGNANEKTVIFVKKCQNQKNAYRVSLIIYLD